MAGAAINNEISVEIIILYISAIFWTLGYDTIYGAQDMSDDEIIGLKSTSIKFKKNIKLFVTLCYLISFILIFCVMVNFIGINYFTLFLFMFFFSLIIKIYKFSDSNPQYFLVAFKFNNISLMMLFLAILTIDY